MDSKTQRFRKIQKKNLNTYFKSWTSKQLTMLYLEITWSTKAPFVFIVLQSLHCFLLDHSVV